jgi:hypothetical protein
LAKFDRVIFAALFVSGSLLIGVFLLGAGIAVVQDGPCAFLPCDPGPPPIGATLTPDGHVDLLIGACPHDRVGEVRVAIAGNGVVGDDDDQVLWDVVGRDTERRLSFEVGTTPLGFTERTPLQGPLPRTLPIVASARGGGWEWVGSFSVNELTRRSISANGDRYTPAAFQRHAGSWCPPPPPASGLADFGSAVARYILFTSVPVFAVSLVLWRWRRPPRTDRPERPRSRRRRSARQQAAAEAT